MNATTKAARDLPKSLHTITAIINVAAHLRETSPFPGVGIQEAVNGALSILGYTNSPDPHGLAAKAVALMSKEG